MKFKYKPKLVPIFVHYFLLFGGVGYTYPYLVLQMRTLGLTLADASLVNGLTPLFSAILSPFLGYLGDKLGYKFVLLFSLLSFMTTMTSLNFLPTYRQFSAKIGLKENFYNETLDQFDYNSIVWFGKYNGLDTSCKYEAKENNIKEIRCEEEVYNVDITFKEDEIGTTLHENCTDLNVETCKYFIQYDEKEYKVCDVIFEGENGNFETGSHSLTLWLYFGLRCLTNVFINGLFNISDGAASTITIAEHSSYSLVMFFGNIGSLIPNFVAGPIVDNINLGSDYWDCLAGSYVNVSDFKIPFFIMDAYYIVLGIIVYFFLNIQIPKSEKKLSFKEEFKWLLNPAPIGFYFIMLIAGIVFGASDTYFFVFAYENLGASNTFLGYISFAANFGSLLILPFAKYALKYLGDMNTMCIFNIIWMLRLVAFGFTYSSPPYELIAYAALESVISLYFVAQIAYTSVVAPQSLIATAISFASVMLWIVGKGVGSILAGILVTTYNIRIMFIVFGVVGSSVILVYWVLYHLIIKKFEVHQNKEKEENTAEEYEQTQTRNQINLTARIVSTRM